MHSSLAEQLKNARIIDLSSRVSGHADSPLHKPGYFYALHRRHRDTYQPSVHGRSRASGVLTMMEHSGTHIDAACHRACGSSHNVDAGSIETPIGFKSSASACSAAGRGILLDVAT